MKLSEALTKYIAFGKYKNKQSSMETYYLHIRMMVLYFHNISLEAVTLDALIEHLDMMKELGWNDRSFTAKCSAYKDFFKFFSKQGYKTVDPDLIPIPSFEAKMPEIITDEEHDALMSVASTHRGFQGLRGRLVLMMFKDTGMRLGELRSLDVNSVDTNRMSAIIVTEKSKSIRPQRMVFWTKETNKVLKEYIKLRGDILKELNTESEALFIAGWGRFAKFGARWGDSTIDGWFAQVSRKANLPRLIHPHMYRHAFGRKLSMEGANNSVISDMMGHASMDSSRIYTLMNPQMMEETYKKHFRGR